MSAKIIIFDARMYGLAHAGIGRYVMNLLAGIKKVDPKEFKIKLIARKETAREIKKSLGDYFPIIEVKSKHYSLLEQFELPKVLNQIKPDLVHFPHFNSSFFYSGKFIVTIHDLIKHYFKGRKTTTKNPAIYWLKYLGYRLQTNYSLKKSQQIIVPSNFWKDKLNSDLNISKEKINVTYEAVDPNFIKLTKNIKTKINLKQYGLTKPFFVYVGSVYPHKNIEAVISAIKSLDNIQLAIICSRSVFTQRVEVLTRELNVQDKIKFLGFIKDKDLIRLCQQSTGLIQPSLMEGFGLTGLEAMAANTPVISSNSSCLPETYGPAALYFNPKDIKQLQSKMESLIKDKDLRNKMIRLGQKQIKKYSWLRTAKQTIKSYRKALS